MKMDHIDRALIAEPQAGLPLVAEPYAAVAGALGMPEDQVMARLRSLKARGIMRRIAIAPNHYKLGMTANGMTVWDVRDADVAELGARIGALGFVSHCYERPRALPD
ncbi:Lrp/AsnC family transcriptional regulator, partial [Streptococcus pyogenes]